MSKNRLFLTILDGYGINKNHNGNAVYEANTPNMDNFMKKTIPTPLSTRAVLTSDFPTVRWENSEVGHTNIGAGRIVYQELTRITKRN
ncbi:MAG: hypothetical protein L6V93_02610 [Clostridiales bacterium]|nr:MAG: hypothetical protein L6V93_02610 [Clostridiales bacterium]